MTRNNKNQKTQKTQKIQQTQNTQKTQRSQVQPANQEQKKLKVPASCCIYTLGFLLLLALCGLELSPVFRHLAEENYFCTDAVMMQHVTSERFGYLYWGGRFLLMIFQWPWLGTLFIALLLTFCAWCVDRLIPHKFHGAGFAVPAAILWWTIYRGYNLYMRCDPSQWLVVAVVITAVFAIAALIRAFIGKKTCPKKITWKQQYGSVIMFVAIAFVGVYAWMFRQNVILSCDMQNKMLDENWQGMIDDALRARHPDHSVAAFYAIACNQQHLLLENLFNIDMNYDDPHLDNIKGLQEGENYIAEMDFQAGMMLSTYRVAQGHLCLLGPRLRYLKLLAVSAIIEGDQALAYRFLTLIDKMPGQHQFVEKYTYLLQNPDSAEQYTSIMRLLDIAPQITEEMNSKGVFEQDYRSPIFIGYNLATTLVNPESMLTSMAAALYVKSLDNVVARAKAMQAQGVQLPLCVQQAIVIASLTNKTVLNSFSIDSSVVQEVNSFAQDASPYMKEKDRQKAAEALRDKWKGTYMYYYFCGNLNTNKDNVDDSGVN